VVVERVSDEYTIAGNFQRYSDDPRAEAEYEYRMRRARERAAELEALVARNLPTKPTDDSERAA
jgi:hypothetical protein